jgi:steroid 5-alpha reductase family enzyme
MNFYSVILINLAVAATGMLLLWVVSLVKKDASIVDPCWGLGFVMIAWSTLFEVGTTDLRGGLLLALVTIWGVRLSAYLFWRNHGKGEDRRYASMREKRGEKFWWISLFTVFLLQGAIMWFISLTVQSGIFWSTAIEGGSFGWLGGLGVAVWAVGFFFESVGDYQMARFKARTESKGKVMNQGLWRFTRHPNYFGDFCVWWGLFLVAANANSWWTAGSPLLMSFLLLNISGVAMLEGDIEERRPDYAKYKRTTNAFFPGTPSKE